MNPFVNQSSTEKWIVPVTLMSLVVGFMISTVWVRENNRSGRFQLLAPDQKLQVSRAQVDLGEFEKIQEEVAKLRAKSTSLENALANQDKGSKALNDQLQEAKLLAGLTEVEGPGILVTLRDSAAAGPQADLLRPDAIVHDTDVQQVVNELHASGAEAVSVNNNRWSTTSSARCVGPVIQIDGVRIASPVLIRAIGEPDTLMKGLNMPGGILAKIRSEDSSMVSTEKVAKISMPAYGGSTTKKYLKLSKEKI